MTIQSSMVDSIDDGDYASAGYLYLEAERDSSPSTKRAIEARFPHIRDYVATATPQTLGIVGNKMLRHEHKILREAGGWTTESARGFRKEFSHEHGSDDPRHDHPRGGHHAMADPLETAAAIWRFPWKIVRILLFPFPQLISWWLRRREPRHPEHQAPTDPDMREVPF